MKALDSNATACPTRITILDIPCTDKKAQSVRPLLKLTLNFWLLVKRCEEPTHPESWLLNAILFDGEQLLAPQP